MRFMSKPSKWLRQRLFPFIALVVVILTSVSFGLVSLHDASAARSCSAVSTTGKGISTNSSATTPAGGRTPTSKKTKKIRLIPSPIPLFQPTQTPTSFSATSTSTDAVTPISTPMTYLYPRLRVTPTSIASQRCTLTPTPYGTSTHLPDGMLTQTPPRDGTAPIGTQTADALILDMLENIKTNGSNGKMGLWLNWRYGTTPLQVNLNGSGFPDAAGTSIRHDPLTDLRYVHAIWLYKSLHEGDTQFDSDLSLYTSLVKQEWAQPKNE